METFRGYQIEAVARLGHGAFGYVEKVNLYNAAGGVCGEFARKILSPHEDVCKAVSWQEIRKRFIREVLYQSRCASKYVMPVYLFDRDSENPYFVMGLADGDLQGDLENNFLSDQDKLNIVRMCLLGVKDIHQNGYLHRDIKPQNVLKFSDGVYKISDFGLVKNTDAQRAGTELTVIGQQMGTHKYMAPEIFYDAEYSIKTDIFALGQVMNDLKIKNDNYVKVLEKCLRKEKEYRYESVCHILNDLSSL